MQLKGERLTEMAELAEAGCVAFGQANRAVRRHPGAAARDAVRRHLRLPGLAAGAGSLSSPRDGVAHDGEVATRLGLPGIPVVAETIALATILHLARETGVRLHLTRISTRRRHWR